MKITPPILSTPPFSSFRHNRHHPQERSTLVIHTETPSVPLLYKEVCAHVKHTVLQNPPQRSTVLFQHSSLRWGSLSFPRLPRVPLQEAKSFGKQLNYIFLHCLFLGCARYCHIQNGPHLQPSNILFRRLRLCWSIEVGGVNSL